MKEITWAVMTAMGLALAIPSYGDDPPATSKEGATESAPTGSGSSTAGGQSTMQVEEIRTGAAGMEPSEQETGEERVERAFVENVWNSP